MSPYFRGRWYDCPILLLWCQSGLEETTGGGWHILWVCQAPAPVWESHRPRCQNPSIHGSTVPFSISSKRADGSWCLGIPWKPSQLRSCHQKGRGQKSSKMGLNKKPKLIGLSLLFPSVFRSLPIDLGGKKNRNKFYRLRMIILKIYMHFFCFNFFEIGNISFFCCPPVGGTSGPYILQAAGSNTNLGDEVNKWKGKRLTHSGNISFLQEDKNSFFHPDQKVLFCLAACLSFAY